MPLLIDGHNLIGAGVFEDIHLSDEDDEAKLAARLRVWKSRYRGKMTVIFDHGITEGTSPQLSGGGVRVIFARNPREADDLIRRRLRNAPRNLVLVTNDRALRQEAAAHGVEVWQGDEFVARMQAASPPKPAPPEPGAQSHLHMSDQEIEMWQRLFERGERSLGPDERIGPDPAPPPRPKPPARRGKRLRKGRARRNAKKK